MRAAWRLTWTGLLAVVACVAGLVAILLLRAVTPDNAGPRLWMACHGYRLAARAAGPESPSLVWGRYLDCSCALEDVAAQRLEPSYAALLEALRQDGLTRTRARLAGQPEPPPLSIGPDAARAIESVLITVAKCQRPFS